MHKLKSQKLCRVQLETQTQLTLVYSWICISLLRNVDSQSDHNDITLLSPTSCSCYCLLLFICNLLMAGELDERQRWGQMKRKL